MNLETVRIDLGDGEWAVIYKDVLHITAKLHQAELRKYMTLIETFGEGGKMLLSEMEKLGTMPKPDFFIDYASVDEDAVNEIYALNQVVEWSFGPVDRETLDRGMPNKHYKKLVEEMDRLYQPTPLADSAS